jgi:Spy/CpxP family protein refolding chaperone
MDMSDLERPATAAASRSHPAPAPDEGEATQRWHRLVTEIGAATATQLSSALERIHTLITSGKIDRASLRALRDEVDGARQAGMIGQQIARFASGRLRQSHERLQLDETLKGVLAHRHRETQSRGIVLKPALKQAEVIVDASLLFSLLNTMLDWALAHAQSNIEFRIDIKSWPQHAQLVCRFAHRPADQVADHQRPPEPAALESLSWRLLEQTAWTMGLPLDRRDDALHSTLTIEFPRTASDEIEGVTTVELDEGFAPSTNSKPLAGSHVLVVSSRRELRVQIRDALRNMGLIIDFVGSVDEAAEFCRDGLPHAIIIESIQRGEKFAHLRDEISAEVQDFVFIEIIEEGNTFEMSGFSGSNVARVGRDVIDSSLPSALMFELSRGL